MDRECPYDRTALSFKVSRLRIAGSTFFMLQTVCIQLVAIA